MFGAAALSGVNSLIYALPASDFHDITVGNDQLVGTPVGYAATTGYDVASGIGSPIVSQLVVDLAAA